MEEELAVAHADVEFFSQRVTELEHASADEQNPPLVPLVPSVQVDIGRPGS